ncbi:hypothetical protein MOQ_006624 [Trypanosoma cruzi marinkellei]|uniref:Uncharacterized protein n=1 Tax=Trypanosoma cruzi marinkellei TaxID=85056 RepID=K2N4K7_TRYCR|nr:hypothetical protein MOQ_006624 [Trypanosoma cruzi marinkellei]
MTHLEESMQPLFSAISECTRADGLPLSDRTSFRANCIAGRHRTPVPGYSELTDDITPATGSPIRSWGLLWTLSPVSRRLSGAVRPEFNGSSFAAILCGRRNPTRVRSYAWAAGQILLCGAGVRTVSHAQIFSVVTVAARLDVSHQGGCGPTQQCGGRRYPSGRCLFHTGGLRARPSSEGCSNFGFSARGVGGPIITSLYPLQYCAIPLPGVASAFVLAVRFDRVNFYLLAVRTASADAAEPLRLITAGHAHCHMLFSEYNTVIEGWPDGGLSEARKGGKVVLFRSGAQFVHAA